MQRTSLLEEDPDLGRWLAPADVVQARRCVTVPLLLVRQGAWHPRHPGMSARDHLGFLVLDGLLAREESLAGSTSTELLGPGDIVQPWTHGIEESLVPRTVRWTAVQPTRLGVLGPSFVVATARWPPIRAALLERALDRCSRISTHHAISQLKLVDARLLMLFWHLAERWGRVTHDGVLMPLRLSHQALGELVGAKRPTVSLALGRLAAQGLIARRPDRTLILRANAQESLERLVAMQHSSLTVSARRA
jgi:CRP-like cAMP-binding protein